MGMKDEDIPKIAEMLLSGGRMLAVHCGTCLSPLFERNGKVVCPICGDRGTPSAKPGVKGTTMSPLAKVEEVLQTKINSLADQLSKETDHAKTLELLERIKSALEALEKVKKE